MVCSQKEGRGQVPQRHTFLKGQKRTVTKGVGGVKKKKTSYFLSWVLGLLGLADRVRVGPQLRTPISYRWQCQPCQLSGARISPQGHGLSPSVPASEANHSTPNRPVCQARALRRLRIGSFAGCLPPLGLQGVVSRQRRLRGSTNNTA